MKTQATDPAGARFQIVEDCLATIKGFQVMRALHKGQARAFCPQPGIRGEVRLVERAFSLGPSASAEAVQMVADHYQNDRMNRHAADG